MFKNRKIEFGYILFLISIYVLNLIFLKPGFYGWDDIEYSNLAYQWANNKFSLSNNHFTYRTPIILLTGICYKLFGVNDISSALPTLLLIFLICLIIQNILYSKDSRIVITAITLFALSYPVILYFNKPMPDIYVALFLFLSFFFHYKHNFEVKKKTAFYSFLCSCSLALAFITKEAIIIVFPVFFLLFWLDIIKNKEYKFWLYTLLFLVLIFLIYHYIIYCKTGNLFSRYLKILQNSYENPCNYENYPFIHTFKRITYEFWVELIKYGTLVSFSFALPFLFNKKLFSYNRNNYWLIVLIIALISANFMTKSYKSYSPMCLDVRHYMFLFPLIAVALAVYVTKFFFTPINFTTRIISLLCCLILLYIAYINNCNIEVNYFNIVSVTLIILTFLLTKYHKLRNLLFSIFILSFLSTFISYSIETLNHNTYKYIRQFVLKNFSNEHVNKKVFCDIVLKRISEYCLTWDTSKVQFIDKTGIYTIPSTKNVKYFYYANSYSWWLSEKINKFHSILDWSLVFPNIKIIDSLLDNRLYEIIKPRNVLIPSGKYYFYCNHEFNYYHNFNIDKKNIVTDNNCYYKIPSEGFSTTFIIDSKALVDSNSMKFEIVYSCNLLYPKPTNALLVLEVRNYLDSCIFWLGKKISEIIKPSIKWQHFKYNVSYDFNNKSKYFIIKLYIWNNDKQQILVDDIKIEITKLSHL
ncbi:MAG: hypothetical protein N3A01_06995 [Bacteroidales bacterium]|nr:hypothetical protein [Bacteroidales bacterium]